MNKWSTLPLVFLLCFCKAKEQRSVIAERGKQIRITEKSLVDSLRKYSHLSEFSSEDDSAQYVLYGKKTKDASLGVVAITDSALLLFHSKDSGLRLNSRILFQDYATGFEECDLNGDGRSDFMVYGFANMHGQRMPYVFMSDSTNILHHAPMLTKYNIRYDADKKQLQSFYLGGANSVHSKEVYRWRGDSIEQVAGIEYDMANGEIELYKVRGGRKYQIRHFYNHNEMVFDTALFKINEEL